MLDRKRRSVASRKDKKKLKEDSWSQKSAGLLQGMLLVSYSLMLNYLTLLDVPSIL